MNQYTCAVVVVENGINVVEHRTVFASNYASAAECILALYKDVDLVGVVVGGIR